MLEHSRQINLPLSYILLKQGHTVAVQAVLGLTLELTQALNLSSSCLRLLSNYYRPTMPGIVEKLPLHSD